MKKLLLKNLFLTLALVVISCSQNDINGKSVSGETSQNKSQNEAAPVDDNQDEAGNEIEDVADVSVKNDAPETPPDEVPPYPPAKPKLPRLPTIPVGTLPEPEIKKPIRLPAIDSGKKVPLAEPNEDATVGQTPQIENPNAPEEEPQSGDNSHLPPGRIDISKPNVTDILKGKPVFDLSDQSASLDGVLLPQQPPHILLSDDFDRSLSSEFRFSGQMNLEPTSGVKGNGATVLEGFAASQNLDSRSFRGKMVANHLSEMTSQQFDRECSIENGPWGDGLPYDSTEYSDKISRDQRNISFEFKNLKGRGNLEVIVQIMYYDANDRLIPKVRADGTRKNNYTLDKIRIPLTCNRQNQRLNFDLFSIAQQNNLAAATAQYQMSFRLSPNGFIAYDGLANANNQKHVALYYDLHELEGDYTVSFFARPVDDLQKYRAEQTLLELSGPQKESLAKVIVQGQRIKVISPASNAFVAAQSLKLDPLYWDVLSLSVGSTEARLYSKDDLLARIPLNNKKIQELCLGSGCDGFNLTRYVFDQLSVYRGAEINYCFSCDHNPSGLVVFKKQTTDFFDANSMVTPSEVLESVSAWGYPGSNEKITFGLRSEISHNDITFEVTPLNNGRQVIAADKVNIRLAKYWKQVKNKFKVSAFDEVGLVPDNTDLTPELLLKDDRQNFTGVTRVLRNGEGAKIGYEYPTPSRILQTSFKAPESKMIWLNVSIDTNQQPGIYSGTFKVKKGRQVLKEIPLRIEVIPLELNPAVVKEPGSDQLMAPSFGMYFRDRVDPPTDHHEGVSFELFEKHVAHMNKLGLNSIELRSVEVAQGQDRMAKFVRVLNLLRRYDFKKIVMMCVHPSDSGGYPDYTYHDRAVAMGFEVYCYGVDEPGTSGMSNQLQRTLEIHARLTRQEKKQHFNVVVPQFWTNFKQVPFFADFAQAAIDEPVANLSYPQFNERLTENSLEFQSFWNDFYVAARRQPRAIKNQIKNAIPQAYKDMVTRAMQNVQRGTAPKVATANYKEISVWMDGYTIEEQLNHREDDLFVMGQEMQDFLEVQFEKSKYDDNPYLEIAPHYAVPFDFLDVTDLGLDVTILSNAFEGFNRYHRDYIKAQLQSMRDEFPMERLPGSIKSGQEEWFYFGNRDARKQVIYTRYMFGYYLFMTKAHGVMPYVYQHTNIGIRGEEARCSPGRPAYMVDGVNVNCLESPDYEDPFVDFDGLKASGRKDDNGIEVNDDSIEKDDFFIYPAHNDYIETIVSEMVREGIKDYKILSTAEQLLIEQGSPADIQKFKQIIGRFMDATISSDNDHCGGYHFCGVTQEALEPYFDTARRELADLIVKLQH